MFIAVVHTMFSFYCHVLNSLIAETRSKILILNLVNVRVKCIWVSVLGYGAEVRGLFFYYYCFQFTAVTTRHTVLYSLYEHNPLYNKHHNNSTHFTIHIISTQPTVL